MYVVANLITSYITRKFSKGLIIIIISIYLRYKNKKANTDKIKFKQLNNEVIKIKWFKVFVHTMFWF